MPCRACEHIQNESVPKMPINDTINLLFKSAVSILLVSNHNSFRVPFDKIASAYFIRKVYQHWKWPARGTSTVSVVSAHFRYIQALYAPVCSPILSRRCSSGRWGIWNVLRPLRRSTASEPISLACRFPGIHASIYFTRAVVGMGIAMGMGMEWVWGWSSIPTDPRGFYGDF